LTWVCGITFLTIASVVGYWMLLSQFTTLTVTDDRTIYQEGFVSRETSEVQHNDVRNIQLDQSFVRRLLGIGVSESPLLAKTIPRLPPIACRIQSESSN